MPGIDLDRLVEAAIRNVYERRATSTGLDAQVWADNVRALWKGVQQGLNIRTTYQQATSYELAAALRQNLFVFAAFKNHAQIEDLVRLLAGAQGQIRPFDDFRREALAISADYNRHWLQAEYDTALASAQSAVRWNDIRQNGDALPYIKYVTAGDGRVRPAHATMDGTTRHMDDPFWDEFFPPNGWNCRCDVQQVAGGETLLPQTLPDDKSVPPTFRNNPGKTGQVFTLQHPYFALVKPEQRGNIMRAAGRLIFDHYLDAQFVKDAAAASAMGWRTVANYPQAIGYDATSGGFLVVNRQHVAAALADELPVLEILKRRGGMLELLDESERVKVKYDLFWDGHFWDIKRLRNSKNLRGTMDDIFRRARRKGKTKLLIHIDQELGDTNISEALYHALRTNRDISLVQLVWNGGRMVRLSADQIMQRATWP